MSSRVVAALSGQSRVGVQSAARAPALVVVGVLLLQAVWILTMPPFRGIDEIDHAYRAAAVAGGQWRASEPAEAGRGNLVEVPASLVNAAHDQCELQGYPGPDNCNAVRRTADGNVLVASAASAYPPGFYWIVGTAAKPFDGAGALYAMRIATAALSLFFIALGAWALGRAPSRWPLVGLIVAATPVLVYSTAIVAPNGVEMAAGIALWSALLALGESDGRESTPLLWVAIVSAVVLGSLRVLGPLFIVMIVATIALLKWRSLWGAVRARPLTVAVGAGLVLASAAAQAVWMYDDAVSDLSSDTPANPTIFSWVNVVVWPLQAIAAFPFRGQAGAPIVYPVVLLIFGILVVYAWRLSLGGERRAIVASLGAAYALPFAFTLLTLGGIGSIWQGRYGLPYSVGIVLVSAWVISQRSRLIRVPMRALIPLAVAYGVAVSACLIKIRTKEMNQNPASSGDPAWLAPSPLVIVMMASLAIGVFVLAVSQGSDAGFLQRRGAGRRAGPHPGASSRHFLAFAASEPARRPGRRPTEQAQIHNRAPHDAQSAPVTAAREAPGVTPGPTVSVLMAVYAGTPAQHLAAALASVVSQTRRADEIVVVVDGPLTSEHDVVLAGYGSEIKRVVLPHNVGLGRALAAGLADCTGDWIARADADDINLAGRLGHQLEVLEQTGADVCSASMQEVEGTTMRAVGVRRSPRTHDEFARRMRMTNPVNHPAVMFRRQAALNAGSYRHLPLLEDYDLWARMLRDGARFVGVDEPLVTYRVDGMLERRADRTLAASERQLQRNLRSYGLLGWPMMLRNRVLRGAYRRLPVGLRARAYALLFRGGDDRAEIRDALRGAGQLVLAAALAAVLGWLTLVVVARTLGPGEYADFSVVWSIYFGVAGILIGLQQETTRSLVAARGEPRRVGLVGAGAWTMIAVVLAALLVGATAFVFSGMTFDIVGNAAGPALLAIPLLAAAMMVNGALAADGRWNALAWLALGDALVRFGVVILVVQLAPGDVAYGVALVAGLVCFVPFIAIGWSRFPEIAGTRYGFVGRSAAAMVSSGCASLLVVALPAMITVTGDGSDRARGVLFAAILLTRTPVLLLANSVRPVVVQVFVASRSRLRTWVWQVAPLVVAATAVAAGIGWTVGPLLLRLLFGSDFQVSGPLMGGLVLAAVLILLQTWTGVALAAIDRDVASTVGWLVAVVIAVGCLLLPVGLEARTLAALLTGPGVGICIHLAVLGTSTREVRLVGQREA